MLRKLPKTKGFFAEFKKFALRGNVIEMAVGIVIGASFNAIVTSIVQGVLNPIIGKLLGKVDLSELKIVLTPATEEVAEVAIKYGMVIQKTLEFTITAFVMFLIIKGMNRLNDVQQKIEDDIKEAAAKKASDEKDAVEKKAAEEKAEAEKKAAEMAKKEEEIAKTGSENTALLKEIVSILKEQQAAKK
ncbi:MAG: large conductance mechanosensitive channel protein MscL [Sphaerochaetaceae bacterium]|nr:large conductance mechanosensitive channel protein MscL [Sphaerochaetaceae bacterium]